MTLNSQTDNLEIDREHGVLTGLTDLLIEAVEQQKTTLDQLALLEQLIDTSEVHFMSEQLIMRRHNYAGLEEHESIHELILTQLHSLKQQLSSKEQGLSKHQVSQLRSHLDSHISTHDRQLTTYLALLSDAQASL